MRRPVELGARLRAHLCTRLHKRLRAHPRAHLIVGCLLAVAARGTALAADAPATTTTVSPAPGPSPSPSPGPAPAAESPAAPAAGALRDPAPRPVAEIRVQNRYTSNTSTMQVFAGVDYLERRDFYVSPGVRCGGTYYLDEALGVEVELSRFFSSLNQAAQQVQRTYGVLPDSRSPTWLGLVGLRYAFGYGKMMIGGVDQTIHFEPQALLQVGAHVNDGSFGPSGLAGIGLLVHLTPRWFVRLDGAMTVDIESRQTGTTTVLGFLPSLVGGGRL